MYISTYVSIHTMLLYVDAGIGSTIQEMLCVSVFLKIFVYES